MSMFPKPTICKVVWRPPIRDFIKVNVDGCSKGNPGPAACAGVFRTDNEGYIGAFAVKLGIKDSVFAELMGIIMAVEIAHAKGWKHLWIESDSTVALRYFLTNKQSKIPAELLEHWLNCKVLMKDMIIISSHIFREGNVVADTLANMGLCFLLPAWLPFPPKPIIMDLVHDGLGIPRYRKVRSQKL